MSRKRFRRLPAKTPRRPVRRQTGGDPTPSVTAAIAGLTTNPNHGACIGIGSTVTAVLTGAAATGWVWQRRDGAVWDDLTGETAEDYAGHADEDGLSLRCLMTHAGGTAATLAYVVRQASLAFSGQPSIAPGQDAPGEDFTLSLGAAGPAATLEIQEFSLNDETDVSGDLVGLTYTGGPEGTLRLVTRATSSWGEVSSETATAAVNTPPDLYNVVLDDELTPAELSMQATEGVTLFYATTASATPLSGPDLATLVAAETADIFAEIPAGDGITTDLDLSVLAVGTHHLQVNGRDDLGAWDDPTTVITITVTDVPGQFGPGDWALTNPASDGDLAVAIFALPAANGLTITDVEVQLDGGAWNSSGGTDDFAIAGLTNGVEVDVALRAVNADGTGAASAIKSATPTAGGGAAVFGTMGSPAQATNAAQAPAPPTHAAGHTLFCLASWRADGTDPATLESEGWSLLGKWTTGGTSSSHREQGLWLKVAGGSGTAAPTINATGQFCASVVFSVTGATAAALLGAATSGTSITATMAGGATGGGNRLVIPMFGLAYEDAGGASQLSGGFVNADLTGLTVRLEGQFTAGAGGGLYVASGTRAAEATIAATTAALAVSEEWGGRTLIVTGT